MLKNTVAAVVYVSESKPAVIAALGAATAEACTTQFSTGNEARLVNTFRDDVYNRSSFVIAGAPLPVAHAAFVLTSKAVQTLPDLRMHSATHPRIGIVDHISVSPLTRGGGTENGIAGELNIEDAVVAAKALSKALASAAVCVPFSAFSDGKPNGKGHGDGTSGHSIAPQGAGPNLSVLLYGAAHPQSRGLAATRRATPYFGKGALGPSPPPPLPPPASQESAASPTPETPGGSHLSIGGGGGSGDSATAVAAAAAAAATAAPAAAAAAAGNMWANVTPDLGPAAVDPSVGVCCVGAGPLVLNYNIRLKTTQRSVAVAAAKAVRARKPGRNSTDVSQRGEEGEEGLAFVEALALEHQGGLYEVACNLLNPDVTTPQMVLERVASVAKAFGVEVDEAYTIGLTSEQICEMLQAELGAPPPAAVRIKS